MTGIVGLGHLTFVAAKAYLRHAFVPEAFCCPCLFMNGSKRVWRRGGIGAAVVFRDIVSRVLRCTEKAFGVQNVSQVFRYRKTNAALFVGGEPAED